MELETTHQHLAMIFMCGTILSVALFTLSSVAWLAFRGPIRALHARWFGLRPEVVDVAVYAYLAIWKLGTILLFVVPWLALVIARP